MKSTKAILFVYVSHGIKAWLKQLSASELRSLSNMTEHLLQCERTRREREVRGENH